MSDDVEPVLVRNEDLPDWVDAYKFLQEPDPDVEWLIPGFMERQSRTILAGVEEGGKSLMTLTLAAQAAVGYRVMDRFEVERPLSVIYFDLEMGRRQTRRRLRMIDTSLRANGMEIFPGSLQIVQKPDGLDLGERAVRKFIYDKVEKIRPDLVVFDPLYKMMSTEGYEKDVKPFLKYLDKLRAELDVAILMVHHLRKRSGNSNERGKDTSDLYGSSLLLRWPETIIALSPDLMRVDKDRDNVFGVNRAYPVQRGSGHNGEWLISLGNPTIALDHRILDYLEDVEGASINQLQRDLGGRKDSIGQSLKRLAAEGRVEQVGNGNRKRWEVVA